MKRNVLFVLLFLSCLDSFAQQIPDSLYRNYLYDTRTAYFRQLPVVKKAVIFWGDSITNWGDWAEFLGFRPVLNRGIAGDNTYGLLARVDEVVRHYPKKLFILVGTNDINVKIPLSKTIENYTAIIRMVKKQSPGTKIFVQSVLPINNQLIGRQYYSGTNQQIQELNVFLKKMAEETGVKYVNVYDCLLDKTGQMDAKYTSDGLHLTASGYLTWVKLLKTKKIV